VKYLIPRFPYHLKFTVTVISAHITAEPLGGADKDELLKPVSALVGI